MQNGIRLDPQGKPEGIVEWDRGQPTLSHRTFQVLVMLLLLDHAAQVVGSRYLGPLSNNFRIIPLGNRSGFSGACLWRVEGPFGSLCLRAWPEGGPAPAFLEMIHRLMELARQARQEFVPAVWRTPQGETRIEHAGRFWDLTTWMPGQADFHALPSRTRLAAACTALAQLHATWSRAGSGSVPCPGVLRRLERLGQWQALLRSGWRPAFQSTTVDPVEPCAEQAWHLLGRLMPRLPARLAPWAARVWPVQPCLCDVWHDHLLFDGGKLTGLVDYGSVKTDHVAVDLARMLGSLVGDDPELRSVGLDAYRRVRPLSEEEEALMNDLDITGTVLGAANWLRWLYHEGRTYDNKDAVARRITALAQRMEKWDIG
jgi:Ser/Thr protein kinase RdoA (MazF antagonist)